MEHAHHAVDDINEFDIHDALRLATEILKNVGDEVNLFDRFCEMLAGGLAAAETALLD